jgi:short-subunit dehydrogenase
MINKNRTNPVAVVTGGTKGIGQAICRKLVDNGFDIITCSRNHQDLEFLQNQLRSDTANVHIFKADLSQLSEVKEFADFIRACAEQLNILVNNAGLFFPGSILEENEDQLEMMMNTNLYSAYHLTRGVIDLLSKGDKPHIFNMCSIASKIAYPNGGSYSISKFAMLGFSKVLREELKTQGIRVTAILPGATWSDSWSGADFPASRLMQAEDIAHLLWSSYQLGPSADVEEIVVRPQLGDL